MLEPSEPEPSPLRRPAIFAGALLVSALAAYAALLLGAWGFDFRRYAQHEGRLRRLVQQQPSLDRVLRGLADEGSLLVEAPDSPETLAVVARRRAGPKVEEVLAKGARHAKTRVFRAGDMLYFLYFDGDDVLRDYTCVSR
jgi:hypothetical protein